MAKKTGYKMRQNKSAFEFSTQDVLPHKWIRGCDFRQYQREGCVVNRRGLNLIEHNRLVDQRTETIVNDEVRRHP